MLNNKVKNGDIITYVKECKDDEYHHLFKDSFTVNHIYKVYDITYEEEYQCVHVIDNRGVLYPFHIGSNLADCFETTQQIRKRKLEKLQKC